MSCWRSVPGQREGNVTHVEATVQVREVKAVQTRSGNTRFVLVDEKGNEYTTFRPHIGQQAEKAEGKRARIEYHEEERGDFRNVYLDAVEVVETDEESQDADEIAWRTAVEAAPWLAGEPKRDLPADELFEKLKPFKDLVEEDIETDR
jgi:hypothetical protein